MTGAKLGNLTQMIDLQALRKGAALSTDEVGGEGVFDTIDASFGQIHDTMVRSHVMMYSSTLSSAWFKEVHHPP